MATRFYFGQIIASPAFAFAATWSAPGSTPTRLLARRVKRQAALSTAPVVATATETTAAILNKQHVQLIVRLGAAQTITGTVKGYALFSESDAAQDCRVQCEFRVIGEDGTVRGTLLAADAGALSSEFVLTTPTNRRIPLLAASNTLTSVGALAGDYLVLEIGHRTHVASGTSYSATIRWHDDPATGDLPEDETSTDTTLAPWIEFSQTLILDDTFQGFLDNPPTGTGSEDSATAASPAGSVQGEAPWTLAEFNTQALAYEVVNRQSGQSTDVVDPTWLPLPLTAALTTPPFPDSPVQQRYVDFSAGSTDSGTAASPSGSVDYFDFSGKLAAFNTQAINYNLVDPTNRDNAGALPVTVPPIVVAPPTISGVSPADASTIAPEAALTFDLLALNGFRRTLVAINFPGSDLPPELVHDGSAFQAKYAASTYTAITGGFRYVLRRTGGWYAGPQPLVFAFDLTGQEL